MEAIKMGLSIFSRQQKIRLLPFVVSSVFFLIQPYQPGSTFLGTIFKVLPIISLIGYVIFTRSQFPTRTKTLNLGTVIPEDRYSYCVLLGLALAVIGDIFVALPYTMFLGGLVFMVVYTCYIAAIEVDGRHRGGRSSSTWLFGLMYINTFLSVQASSESYFFKAFLLLYFIPLFLAGWKAASALEENPGDKAILLGCIGASLFIISDCLVILEHNDYPVPFAEFIYMLTYYGAQFGWAASTSNYN
ncbi:lysoplasmalogenase-like [Mercenaria mercenaria]|uniref:lysoplasmalogenase-like n=1 Tax=Mercenaria mercenaria TaxID=6596 RepID=UPI00234F3D13|nr:lysoplasmalogenase-like [Mercenaria mercenaria]